MKDNYKSVLPDDLYQQIEEIYKTFQDIQNEVSGIVNQTKVSDTAAHLEDVLQSTEAATITILDAATAIQNISDRGDFNSSSQTDIAMHVTKIYEACNFQDVTGQRIKKVLKNLSVLEEGLRKLAETAKAEAGHKSEPVREKSLLNGPQLTSEAPTQDEIDKLFSSLK